ncbi:MAG: transketolase family protein [Eubacteriales bacterium]|nr:transketolase family protein [Eubacteriales bacterium]MDD3863111.1 transketolase family protein [Eubacteriales bacterium]MDD4445995.1 transketolase family protein [Eubacteriales bacterium]
MADKIATRQSYGKALVELGAVHQDIVVLDADLSGSTMTKEFAKVYPERFFNAGIAEANMYGMAAGLAISGKTVFASTFAIFAAGRAFEIIRNSIGYTGANVKICATHAGLTVGEDGASHQAIEDLALMRTIPGMTVLNPADDVSARKLLKAAADMQGPVYVRLGRAAVPVIYEEETDVQIGKALTLREGKDYTIIATGILVSQAADAAEQLAGEGIDVRVIDMHTLKPMDEEAVVKAAMETKGIVTVEEHSVIGGLGAAVAQICCAKAPAKVSFVGIRDTFGESGKPDELLEKYGLTAAHIADAVRAMQ